MKRFDFKRLDPTNLTGLNHGRNHSRNLLYKLIYIWAVVITPLTCGSLMLLTFTQLRQQMLFRFSHLTTARQRHL